MASWSDLLGTPAHFARRMAFATGVGLFFGLIGPFGSYDSAALPRVASWLLTCWAGTLVFGAAYRLAESWAGRSGVPRLFARCVAVLASAIPVTAFAALCFHLIVGVRLAARDGLLWYAQVVAIGLPTTLGYVLLAPLRRDGPTIAPAPGALPPVDEPAETDGQDKLDAVFARLPPRLGREVIALQMEDHYVRVHTPKGSELALMPISQAVEALQSVDGLRVHRSWWVARAAVVGTAFEGRNLRLKLKGGLQAPVARSSVAQVRAAGWLPQEDATPR